MLMGCMEDGSAIQLEFMVNIALPGLASIVYDRCIASGSNGCRDGGREEGCASTM